MVPFRSFTRSCCLVAAGFCMPPVALASSEPSLCENDPVCRQHLDLALQLDQEQKYEASHAEFRAAYRRHRSGRLALNIGRSLHKLGRYDEALSWYQTAGRAAPADAEMQKELRNFAEDAQLVSTKPKVPSLDLSRDIQMQTAQVNVAPINNIHIVLAPPMLKVAAAPVDPKVPTNKRLWLWTAVSLVVAASAAGVAVASYPRPYQPTDGEIIGRVTPALSGSGR